jgi:hypothetical protein
MIEHCCREGASCKEADWAVATGEKNDNWKLRYRQNPGSIYQAPKQLREENRRPVLGGWWSGLFTEVPLKSRLSVLHSLLFHERVMRMVQCNQGNEIGER